jgi:hypothetical protein
VNEGTKGFLSELEELDWFSCVGMPIDDETIIPVSDWPSAIAACTRPDSERASLEARNRLTRRLAVNWKPEYQRWNLLVREVKSVLLPIIDCKIVATVTLNRLPNDFQSCVAWDLLNVCMELEYEGMVAPRYFSVLASWYLKGHFPCGWEAGDPDRRVLVF